MPYSSQQLADLQRAAGIFGITVDELIERNQAKASPLPSRTNTQDPQRHRHTSSSDSSGSLRVQDHSIGASLAAPSNTNRQRWDGGLGISTLEAVRPDSPETGSLEQSSIAHGSQSQNVELLNPQRAYSYAYGCNDRFSGIPEDFDVLQTGLDPLDGSEEMSYVQVSTVGSENGTDMLFLDEEQINGTDELGSDLAIVSSPADPFSPHWSPDSPVVASGRRQYHWIAPKPSSSPPLRKSSSSGSSTHRVRKRRSPYQASKKSETNLTRQLNACVRCKLQRNRCIPDPNNPSGPCLPCQVKMARISRLPCLRYKLTESTLFRTGLDYMQFYKDHPIYGPQYGDFHIPKTWIGESTSYLSLTQMRGSDFQIELRKFQPPVDPTAVDLKGRSMYAVPWAIPDPESACQAINGYIDMSIGQYLDEILEGMDGFEYDVFHVAYRASIFPIPNLLLQKTIRLWVACRFIESRWMCWGDQEVTAENPQDPFYEWQTPPPYLDYQMASVIIYRILDPLRHAVLRELQSMVNEHKPEDWYITFLTSFILLQNYELQMKFQREFAARRSTEFQYLDMPLVRATNSGAKTILAHFHYCCKGQKPFDKKFDWSSPKTRRMAKLDEEQASFMSKFRDSVIRKAPEFDKLNHSHEYHKRYWYTSQLFDPNWVPRDTLEHSPPPL